MHNGNFRNCTLKATADSPNKNKNAWVKLWLTRSKLRPKYHDKANKFRN